jgi:hypothetical protein
MSATAVIGLGMLTWVLVAVPVALFVARMIKLRDREHPGPAQRRIREGTAQVTGSARHRPPGAGGANAAKPEQQGPDRLRRQRAAGRRLGRR